MKLSPFRCPAETVGKAGDGANPAPTLFMEELEPRLLLSADASFLLGAALWTTPEAPAFPDMTGPDMTGGSPSLPEASPELLFVDTTTPDYAQLIDDVLKQNSERPFQVILLDPARDGVEQIGETLAARHAVPAIHIIGHGTEGRFLLGNGELSAARIARDGAELTRWGSALSADADILLYGCNVAAGDAGRALVEGLAYATGADVAASTDATGQATLGGDWDLEYRAGRIDTPVAFGTELRQDWMGVLMHGSDPPYVVNNTGSTATEGGTDTLTSSELRYDDSGMMSWQIDYSVTAGPTNGRLELSTNPGVAITAFTQTDIDNNRLRYVHDGSSTNSDGFTFDVADSGGNTTANQSFSITITQVNDAPVVNNQSFSANENSVNGTVVGTVAATDQDGDALSYSITAGNTNNAFAINAATGQITVNNANALDFETTPSFSLTVQVSDGTLTDTAAVTINLSNVNDAPVVNNQNFGVDENSANGTVVGSVAATDADGNTLSYSITAGNTNNAFTINAATGQITVNNASALDFETTPSFGLTVQVQDNGTGMLTDTATVTINLNDLNDAPVVNNQSFGVDENSANGTVVGNVVATDADGDTLAYSITAGNTNNAFTINAATGQITVNDTSALNFETSPTFTLTVQVQDNGTGTLTDTATVTINLNDVNESPTVNDQNFTLQQGSANGTVVGTVIASDVDGDTPSYSITAGDLLGAFSIDPASGQITVANNLVLILAPLTYNLTVEVDDGTLIDTATITITISALPNSVPAVNDQGFGIDENSANGTVVGSAAATDADGDTLTYSITAGNTGNAFA
ncbi:MAG: cadherin domain-containing protein, partial [Gammaproteobacteria bacterium]|nr:cadherin domain-containing protein [Gammaproteobacteria bacterium]